MKFEDELVFVGGVVCVGDCEMKFGFVWDVECIFCIGVCLFVVVV